MLYALSETCRLALAEAKHVRPADAKISTDYPRSIEIITDVCTDLHRWATNSWAEDVPVADPFTFALRDARWALAQLRNLVGESRVPADSRFACSVEDFQRAYDDLIAARRLIRCLDDDA